MGCRPKPDNDRTKFLSRNLIDHQSPVLPVSLELFDNHREPSFTTLEKKQNADFDYQQQQFATLSLEYRSFVKSPLSPVKLLIDQKYTAHNELVFHHGCGLYIYFTSFTNDFLKEEDSSTINNKKDAMYIVYYKTFCASGL